MTVKIDIDARVESVRFEEQASAPVSPSAGYTHVFVKSDGLYIVNDSDEEIGPFITGSANGGYTEGVRAYRNTGTATGTGAWTSLPLNSERYDTDTMHSGSSSQLYCNTAGKYSIMGNIVWQADSGGNFRGIRIYLNNSIKIAQSLHFSIDASTQTVMDISTIYNLSVGDYVELQGIQDSGGDLNIEYDANISPEFMAQRIG